MTRKNMIKITKTLKLLYVEDDENTRKSTLEMLENFFTDITVGVDGEDGWKKFQTAHFDMVLSDINMPKLNGLEFLKKIRTIDENMIFLLLSAHNESEYLLESIEQNADGYILKPLKLKQFTSVLSKIAEKIKLKDENENYKLHLEEEIKRQTQELQHKLYYDELTGLQSRYSFFEDIKKQEAPIVLLVDINKFKIINEIHGSSIGSLVLQKFAVFLLEFSQNSSYKVYRISGDEFAIADLVEQMDPDKYENDLKFFFECLNKFQVNLHDDTIFIEVTIGISTFQKDAYESAKVALDSAKEHKLNYLVYSSKLDNRDVKQDALAWKSKIKYAIKNNLVVPVYHQIVDKEKNVVKSETLMRIKDETTGSLITPYHFLDIAMKTGLYNALSSSIIFDALHFLEASKNILSLNFTYSDIKNTIFLNDIELFFKASPLLGKRAVFEITESESISNYDDVKSFIKRFKRYGIRFAIDDFGSGFSNFEYILEIAPDYLKIDGSLVKDIDKDEKAYILVKAIIEFSHELGIKVIAEYVHSKVIFEILKKLDVDEYQGFYFYEPIECDKLQG